MTYSLNKDGANLFQVLLLFIAHCKEANKSHLETINLGETGLNLIEVIS